MHTITLSYLSNWLWLLQTLIAHVHFFPRCSIGSLGWDLQEAGVQNVTVKSSTFTGSQNGVRIKTWARSSNGFVRDVLFQHAVMINVQNPIIIDQNYCPHNNDCPNQVRFVQSVYCNDNENIDNSFC